MKKKSAIAPPAPMAFPRADRDALAIFDASTKACTMNCGPSTTDPRDWRERRYLCDDCLTLDTEGKRPAQGTEAGPV